MKKPNLELKTIILTIFLLGIMVTTTSLFLTNNIMIRSLNPPKTSAESLLGIIKPNGDLITNWNEGDSAPHWSKLDEATGDMNGDGGNIGESSYTVHDRWNFSTLTIQSGYIITKLIVYIYCKRSTGVYTYIGVTSNAFSSGHVTPPYRSYAWKSFTKTGLDINQSTLNSLYVDVCPKQSQPPNGWIDIETVYIEVYQSPARKIGVLFWASDATKQQYINEYKTILESEGYTKFFEFKDSDNFTEDFNTVDNFESYNDIIFFYLTGHGNYNESLDDSYTAFMTNGNTIIYSSEFRTMMDNLESTIKGFIIESCKSGGWVDDFDDSSYFAISTSSISRYAHLYVDSESLPKPYYDYPDYNQPVGEGIFSDFFWNNISAGGSVIDAWEWANFKNYLYYTDHAYMYYDEVWGHWYYLWGYQQAQKYNGLPTYTFFAY